MLQLGCFALEDTITDQVKYMFPPVDLKQPEGTKRDLYIPARIRKTTRIEIRYGTPLGVIIYKGETTHSYLNH